MQWRIDINRATSARWEGEGIGDSSSMRIAPIQRSLLINGHQPPPDISVVIETHRLDGRRVLLNDCPVPYDTEVYLDGELFMSVKGWLED